jgi:hypothetical protein
MSPLFAALFSILLIIVIFIAIIIGVKNLQSMRDDQEDTGKRHHKGHNNIGGDPATWSHENISSNQNKNLGGDPRTWGPVTEWEGSQRFANSLSDKR